MAERISRRQFVTGSAFALGGLAAAAIVGCGEEEKKPQVKTQKTLTPAETVNPTPTPSPEPTPAPTPEPTPEPTPAPTEVPEEWSDETIATKLYSVVDLANQVADAYPQSELLSTVKDDTQTAFEDFKQVLKTKDYQSVLSPLNGFGNIGSQIGQFACFTTEGKGEPEGQAWLAIRELVLNTSLKYEKAGYLEEGMTQTFKEAFFTVHESCTNPIILSSNN